MDRDELHVTTATRVNMPADHYGRPSYLVDQGKGYHRRERI
jgi:hypothetical protein